MGTKKREARKQREAAQAALSKRGWRGLYWAIAAAAAMVACWVYGPSMRAPFLFDDNYLPFALPSVNAPLSAWLRGVRPLLMFTYWFNQRLSGDDTLPYHLVNVFFHCLSSGLVYFIVLRLLEWAGSPKGLRPLLAGFAAAVFLLHPVQTEAVAYLAGRSDGLSVMLVLAGYAVFLYRPDTAVPWPRVVLLLGISGAALATKEHAVVLPALLLLTDLWWNPGHSLEAVRRNWRLYAPLVLGGLGGVVYLLPLILHSTTAGFGLKDLTWYQYFFTQCRALFVYPQLFVFPVNQSADWNFQVSHTILEHGAIFGLIALLALAAVAWRGRRKFPLASFGFFAYLLLMAPTSSILPIRDAVAERRLYLSMLGLLLIVVDFLARMKIERKVLATACAVVALILAVTTRARAQVWSSEVSLWEDTVQKSPENARAHFQLASAHYNQGRCADAVSQFAQAAHIEAPKHDLLVDWGLAYDCLNQPEQALAKFRQAAALEATAEVYSQIGMIYGKRAQWKEALEALATAEKLDPNFAATHYYKGLVHFKTNQPEAAVEDYRRVLAIDPRFPQAREGLAQAQALLAARR